MSDVDPFGEDADETGYAQRRLPSRTYASKAFPLKRTNSTDDGSPARFICKVFDPVAETTVERDGTDWTIHSTPAGRYQFKLLVAREAGLVKDLWIQRVPAPGRAGQVKNLLHLPQDEAATLIEFLRTLEAIPVDGDTAVRVDDRLIQDLFANPDALTTLYQRDPSHFRQLISDDAAARDVVATAARRSALEEFRHLLFDDEHFNARQAASSGNGAESVWQDFFEANPWIFGVSLAGQLLTSWDVERLEQVVAGSSISEPGKRSDALMRTAGVVQSMVFAEIKTHRASLLGPAYRPGCWRASIDLTGGVTQAQVTVHRATLEIGERIAGRAGDGSEIPGDFTYLLRPRSFLVIGRLDELIGEAGGAHNDRVRSFELFRRHLQEPEIVTFDELLARAEWVVETAGE